MSCVWKEKTIEAGKVNEKIAYLHCQSIGHSRKRNKSKDEKMIETLNRRIRHLSRLINCNFSVGDSFVTLTYSHDASERLLSDMPSDVNDAEYEYCEANKEIRSLIDRCRYHCKKLKIRFLCIYVTSNMERDHGNPTRIHHHLLVNREAVEILTKQWTNGYVDVEPLRDQLDYIKIASYMLNQVPYIKGKDTYGRTSNLETPIVATRTLLDPDERLVAPEGATILKSSNNYLRYAYGSKDE